MVKPLDIFITAYLRPQYTLNTIRYLKERTKYPYRLFLIDNGGNETAYSMVDHVVNLKDNFGIHASWNVALALAESEYFITSDNDIYVPDLGGGTVIDTDNYELTSTSDWLGMMVKFMDERPNYGAISLHPHVFIGIAGEDPNDPEDVKEAPMCGAVMRIMRREAVLRAGGWERKIDPKRNHEERTICSRLYSVGYKVGRTTRIRAYHPFGKDIPNNQGWGYDSISPEQQGHNPALKDEVLRFDNPDAYDPKTWLPK